MLKLRNTPRRPRENLLMAGTDQQHIRQYRDVKGFLDPSLLPAHLVCPQAQVRLELPIDLLHWPPSLIRTHHLSWDPLVEIGHQDFRMFWAEVRDCSGDSEIAIDRAGDGFYTIGPDL